MLKIVVVGLCLVASALPQNSGNELRATFEKLYARVDAAVAAKDQAAAGRLISADGYTIVGPFHIGIRGTLAEEMATEGLSLRSEVKDVRMEGDSAVVTTDIH